MRVNCEQAAELIQRQLDGDLSEIEKKELHHHLAHCPSCSEEHKQYRQVDKLLKELPKVNPDRSVVDSLELKFLVKEKKGNEKGARFTKGKWLAGTMVAVVLLAVALIWGGGNDSLTSSELSMAQDGAPEDSAEIFSGSRDEAKDPIQAEESDLEHDQLPEDVDEAAMTQLLEDEEDESLAIGLKEGDRAFSPDRTYLAYIGPDGEDLRLDQVVNGEYKPYYIAINPQGKEWGIKEMRWVSEHELYYVLYHRDTEEEQYWLINVPERQEQQLEHPIQDGAQPIPKKEDRSSAPSPAESSD